MTGEEHKKLMAECTTRLSVLILDMMELQEKSIKEHEKRQGEIFKELIEKVAKS